MGCSRDVWPGRRGMYRLLIWRRACLMNCNTGLVAECAESLRRWSCRKSTGVTRFSAPTVLCAMHAGDQAGAQKGAHSPHMG